MENDPRLLLLEQIRKGDRAALGQLLEEVRPYLRVIVHSVRGGQQSLCVDDSDLIQEAMLQASHYVDTFRGKSLGEWLGWLRMITIRTTNRTLSQVKPPVEFLAADELLNLAGDSQLEPSSDAIRQENAAKMALAMGRLPEEMQQVLLGRLVDGLDHAELAERLNRNTGAVRMLYLRALRRLRELWQTEFSSEVGL